jgi:chromosome segregation ATPase
VGAARGEVARLEERNAEVSRQLADLNQRLAEINENTRVSESMKASLETRLNALVAQQSSVSHRWSPDEQDSINRLESQVASLRNDIERAVFGRRP